MHFQIVRSYFCYFLSTVTLLTSLMAHAFTNDQSTPSLRGSIYRSSVDDLLTIKSIAILPASGNTRGIYAGPLDNALKREIDKNHHWNLVEFELSGPTPTPTEIEQDPLLIQSLSKEIRADAFISPQVVKGPRGISLKLLLFMTRDSQLLAKETLNGIQSFGLKEIKYQSKILLQNLFSRIPYKGLILSRQGNRVTVNMGKLDGMENGSILSVIQIIKARRHPKFKFLVDTEKEILGRIKLLKVDDTLSFAKIMAEKEKGAIQKDAKVLGTENFQYTDTDSLGNSSKEKMLARADGLLSFGKNPLEWLPKKPPTFGQFEAYFGLGLFSGNKKATGSTQIEVKDPYYPNITLGAELWITNHWGLKGHIKQGIITGSSSQNISLSTYDLMVAYNVWIGPDVWGPRISFFIGLASHILKVDAPTSQSLSSNTYNGTKLGIQGSYPVTEDKVWHLGAMANFYFQAQLKETPSSGKSSNAIAEYGLFGSKKLTSNLKILARINFELYSSSFPSAASSSEKHSTISSGLIYMF